MSEEQARPDVDLLLVGPAACSLERPLTSLGYQALAVVEGPDALAQLQDVPVLGVLVDIDVEHIELRDLVTEARALQPHAATLVLAPATRSHEVVAALVAGVDGYLPHPPEANLLIDRLERFLAGAYVRWQQADGADDADLFVDEAPTFEWDEGTASGPDARDPVPGTQENESRFATVSRVPVPFGPADLPMRAGGPKEGTVREAAPGRPVSYDPADFPPQVHDVPTGPTGPAPGADEQVRSETVTVFAPNPGAARSLDGNLVSALESKEEVPGSTQKNTPRKGPELEEEALAFEEGEATMALGDESVSSEMPTTAGIIKRRTP